MAIFESTASFTRPSDTTQYSAADLVANSTTAGSVTPMAFAIPNGRGFKLWGATVKKSTATPTNAKFRLHLYKDSPTVTNGDNGAWLSINANYLGSVDVDASVYTFSDADKAFGAVSSGPEFLYTDADDVVFGLLAATAAYTPASAEVFTVSLLGETA